MASHRSLATDSFRCGIWGDLEDWLWVLFACFPMITSSIAKSQGGEDLPAPQIQKSIQQTAWLCFGQCLLSHGIQVYQARYLMKATFNNGSKFSQFGSDNVDSNKEPSPRNSPESRPPFAGQGYTMVMALVPSVLIATASVLSIADSPDAERWACYAQLATLSISYAMLSSTHINSSTFPFPFLSYLATAITVLQVAAWTEPDLLTSPTAVLWITIYLICMHGEQVLLFFDHRPSGKTLQNVTLTAATTWGEYHTLVLLGVVGLMEWFSNLSTRNADFRHVDDYLPLVTQSGCLGCYLASTIATRLSLVPKLLSQVLVPLTLVEFVLWWTSYTTSISGLPLCMGWLVDFLAMKENGHPRFWGLIYWGIALVGLSLPTLLFLPRSVASKDRSESMSWSVVMTRKWFHLVAIILFSPTTVQFPRLLCLSYAIALCVLIVLESVRKDWPTLQSFYDTFQDPAKDLTEGFVVSHMFLILGCAMPFWLSRVIWTSSSGLGPSLDLLAQWGILCLGLGDALGAVVGKGLGRHRWGKNQRTIEGSAAMWFSMIGVGLFGFPNQCNFALLLATTLTTFLEAYTVQMDNLVLPLVGASIILLISPFNGELISKI